MKLSRGLSNLVLVSSMVMLTPADSSPFPLQSQKSNVVCKSCCWDCNDFYIGKTKRRLHDLKTDHLRALTGNIYASAVADHTVKNGHNIKWDHF